MLRSIVTRTSYWPGHSAQQFAVLDPGTAATGDSVYRMTVKVRRKAYW
jgi:hypothetical protein